MNAELDKAVEQRDVTQAKSVIIEGADVNHKTQGMTPLMQAVLRGDRQMVKVILDAHPDLTITSIAGKTAADYALEVGDRELALKLGFTQYTDQLVEQYNSSPVSTAKPDSTFTLYAAGTKHVPVGREINDLQEMEEAIQENRDADAMKMIRMGRVFMAPNGSAISILDSQLRISKIKIKKDGREGWVVNTLIK